MNDHYVICAPPLPRNLWLRYVINLAATNQICCSLVAESLSNNSFLFPSFLVEFPSFELVTKCKVFRKKRLNNLHVRVYSYNGWND